jgi:hypothetical protein
MQKLLIIACSATKRETAPGELLHAINLYDGPGYRTLRKHLRNDVAVLVLSAEHGLIQAYEEIATYNRKMTAKRAGELSAQVAKVLEDVIFFYQVMGDKTLDIHVHGGKTYRDALPLERLKELGATFGEGGIGLQLGALKTWLQSREEFAS